MKDKTSMHTELMLAIADAEIDMSAFNDLVRSVVMPNQDAYQPLMGNMLLLRGQRVQQRLIAMEAQLHVANRPWQSPSTDEPASPTAGASGPEE